MAVSTAALMLNSASLLAPAVAQRQHYAIGRDGLVRATGIAGQFLMQLGEPAVGQGAAAAR